LRAQEPNAEGLKWSLAWQASGSRFAHHVSGKMFMSFRKSLHGSLLLALSALLVQTSSATSYYVDARIGSDAHSGTAATPAGAVGPWQTLARLASANLKPGDAIFLRCGQTWRETLKVPASGTADQAITVSHYPSGCVDRPVISGAVRLPASSWIREASSGEVYGIALPGNLLTNGGFESGTSGWRLYTPENDGALNTTTNCDGSTRCLEVISSSGGKNTILFSQPFVLESGQPATVSFRLKAPAGKLVTVTIRRNQSPYDSLGLAYKVSGTGAWKQYALSFTSRGGSDQARVDFEIPPSRTQVFLDDVKLEPQFVEPSQVFFAGARVEPAHHPNWNRSSATALDSFFLPTTGNADQIVLNGRKVSTYLNTGVIPGVPSGTNLAGAGVVYRANSWSLEERQVASHSDGKITLSQPSGYALTGGWGYLLKGQAWMLDSPGEWHYNKDVQRLTLWTPDSSTPSDNVVVTGQRTAIDASSRSNLVFDGLTIFGAGIGISLRSSSNVTIRDCDITDTHFEAVEATGSRQATLEGNRIMRTGKNAISGYDASGWMASDMRLIGNTISGSTAEVRNGIVVSLPAPTDAAIRPGNNAYVARNIVTNSGGNGMRLGLQSIVENNLVQDACLIIDDCAGIYANRAGRGVQIRNNVVDRVHGTAEGRAHNLIHGVGIYLDDLISDAVVEGNTIMNTYFGLQLHNGFRNKVQGNTLVGNQKFQMWLQEDTANLNAQGDLYDNIIADNKIVSLNRGAAVHSLKVQTVLTDTSRFASFSGNVYSSLLGSKIIEESTSGGHSGYTLSEWRQSTGISGTARNYDSDGKDIAPPSYMQAVAGPNVIANGNFASGLNQWHLWSAESPRGTVELAACPVGPCARIIGGAGTSLVSSPYFSVIKEQWYKLTFDMRTGTTNQRINLSVRRGGGGSNNYQLITDKGYSFYGTTEWQRYSISFKSKLTVNAGDPITLDNGVRADFEQIAAGQKVELANLEMVPINDVERLISIRVIANTDMESKIFECPDIDVAPELCSQYVRFEDGNAMSWPYTLDPLESVVVYSVDSAGLDADFDGIPDGQDACPGTESTVAVNSGGCAITQLGN
jgi:parallel beta-helix repeat protein